MVWLADFKLCEIDQILTKLGDLDGYLPKEIYYKKIIVQSTNIYE